MAYSLSIEPYRTDRSDFRITVNRETAKLVASVLQRQSSLPMKQEVYDICEDLAFTISSALERWK